MAAGVVEHLASDYAEDFCVHHGDAFALPFIPVGPSQNGFSDPSLQCRVGTSFMRHMKASSATQRQFIGRRL